MCRVLNRRRSPCRTPGAAYVPCARSSLEVVGRGFEREEAVAQARLLSRMWC